MKPTAYLHAGGQYEWDSAAPVAVATRCRTAHQPAGRHPADATTTRTSYLPDLLICRPELADQLLEAVAAEV
ncbi:MAG: hypothetical protein WKF47_05610 [Geodermatophilaceae bacterium]